jgi:pilus assembly protein Flp/PilA
MKQLISRLMREEKGQGMAEYGLILALIAVVVIGALTLLGTDLQGIFTNITNAITP